MAHTLFRAVVNYCFLSQPYSFTILFKEFLSSIFNELKIIAGIGLIVTKNKEKKVVENLEWPGHEKNRKCLCNMLCLLTIIGR